MAGFELAGILVAQPTGMSYRNLNFTKEITLTEPKPNTLFIEVSGSGLPEVDGLFVPSTAPPTMSEAGKMSTPGYWNGRMAWDRADGKCARSPAISYSIGFTSWRICRLDGHLAYHITVDSELPPEDGEWDVYRMAVAPGPKVTIHYSDPRES